jgi:hypothetical protein
MAEDNKAEKKRYSYDERRRTFYPSSTQRRKEEPESPYQAGVRMAHESLKRVKETSREES